MEPLPAADLIELPSCTAMAWRVRILRHGTGVMVEVCYIRSIGPRRVEYQVGVPTGMRHRDNRRSAWFLTIEEAQAHAVKVGRYIVSKLRLTATKLEDQVARWSA